MWDHAPSLSVLEEAIADPTSPIGMRMRAAYFLKHLHSTTGDDVVQQRVVECLCKGLKDTRHGSLMRHEYAYVMGQLRDEHCCSVLESTLLDGADCAMVRHEAAEALAAIGAANSRPVLEQALQETADNAKEVHETCLLAINVMDWRLNGSSKEAEDQPVGCACMLNPYSSVDPAPPHPAHAGLTPTELGDILCDNSLTIFDRYRAMFSLRNRGGEEAVKELCRALNLSNTQSSPLLRHEVAYVLGQLQHAASVKPLEQSLRNNEEHMMVRHEAAEALGAIEGAWDQVEAILGDFLEDDNPVVRESCIVALDAADYWGHNVVSPEDKEDEDSEEKKEQSTTTATQSSFAKEKAQATATNAITTASNNNNQTILNQHFNTASA